jgi:hypothetical protein
MAKLKSERIDAIAAPVPAIDLRPLEAGRIRPVGILMLPMKAFPDDDFPAGANPTVPNETPDLVVLAEPWAEALVAGRLGITAAAIVPVVDAAGTIGGTASRRADASVPHPSPSLVADAVTMLVPMIERMRALPLSVLESDDPRLALLARLHVRDRAMEPRRDHRSRETVVYDDEVALAGARRHADALVDFGLMERRFADMVTACPRCDSARLVVRECCGACGSADVEDQPVIHHMTCAHQGPERDFRKGSELSCPKCRKALRQFSLDYDRPGTICVCRRCGHASTDASVRFACLDCGSEVDARDTMARPVHSYALTPAGTTCITEGAALPQDAGHGSMDAVSTFVGRHEKSGHPCCVLAVRLRPPPGTPERGRAWLQTRSFFGILMRECFTPDTVIVERESTFLALLDGDTGQDVKEALPEIRRKLEHHLALAPRIDFEVYDPLASADDAHALRECHA